MNDQKLTHILGLSAAIIGFATFMGVNNILIQILVAVSTIYLFLNSFGGVIGMHVVRERLKEMWEHGVVNVISEDSFEIEMKGGIVEMECKIDASVIRSGITYGLLSLASSAWLFVNGWIILAVAVVVSTIVLLLYLARVYVISRALLDRTKGKTRGA